MIMSLALKQDKLFGLNLFFSLSKRLSTDSKRVSMAGSKPLAVKWPKF